MKKTMIILMLALFCMSTVGCKSGLFARRRGAPCSQCNSSTPQMLSSSPCASGSCNMPYVSNSPGMIESDYNEVYSGSIAPSEGMFYGSSQGILPSPPGPIGN